MYRYKEVGYDVVRTNIEVNYIVSHSDSISIHDPSVPPHHCKEASHTVTTRRGGLYVPTPRQIVSCGYPSTATAPWHALAGFCSVGALDIVPAMPARSSVAKATQAAPLRRLATNAGEQCGLVMRVVCPCILSVPVWIILAQKSTDRLGDGILSSIYLLS